MINKELLHRFFIGTSTLSEEEVIRQWIDDNKENQTTFLQERLIYDSLLLNENTILNKKNKTNKNKVISWNSFLQVAAIFLLLITSGLLLNKYFETQNITPQLHTVIVPPGQRINLILADNTSIWINANTTFKYPSKFSKKQRDVYLDGEAYFEVSENKKQPFIVNTHKGGIKVTGTSFNVSAYTKFNTFETSLFEGSVSVYLDNNKNEIIKMIPSQKTIIRNGKLEVEEIKDYDEFLWKKGLIAFNNKDLTEILSVLEKYFDTKIQIDAHTLPKNTYTGKFRQSDGIDYALRILQKSINFTYQRDNEEQIIHINDTKS